MSDSKKTNPIPLPSTVKNVTSAVKQLGPNAQK